MEKTAKAKAIIKLLKQGYSPREITQRMDASYNYAWTLQKELATEKAAAKAAKAAQVTILNVDTNVYPISEPKKEEVAAILDERAITYGCFVDVAEIAQEIKATIRIGETNRSVELPVDQSEALDMIASKIARILNGDPNHTDSWIDIAGYATLVADRIQGKAR